MISPAKSARPLAPAVRVLIAIRPLPSTLVNDFVEARLGVEPRRDDVEAARRAAEAVERHRALDLRTPRDHRDGDIGAEVVRRARPGHQPRADDRGMSLEAAGQHAVPSSATPTGPNGVASAMLLSARPSAKLGSWNGLLLGGGSSLSIWPQLTLPCTRRPRSRTPRATTR